MKNNRARKKPAKATVETTRRQLRGEQGEDHLGATEEQVGDRTGSGAGYDQKDKSSKKPAKGGVST